MHRHFSKRLKSMPFRVTFTGIEAEICKRPALYQGMYRYKVGLKISAKRHPKVPKLYRITYSICDANGTIASYTYYGS